MNDRWKTIYLGTDLGIQSVAYIATVLGAPTIFFGLIGLLGLGAVQLLSALVGAVLLQDKLRAIYLGCASCFLVLGYGITQVLDTKEDFLGPVLIIWGITAFLGGTWYLVHTYRAWGVSRSTSRSGYV